MKKFEELRREAATQLPLVFPYTCLLRFTTEGVPHENANARSLGEAAAVGGDLVLVRAIRAGVRGESSRETSDVIVLCLAAVLEPVTASKAQDAPQDGSQAERVVMEAVLHIVHRLAVYVMDGRKMDTLRGTARAHVSPNILDLLPLHSQAKAGGRSDLRGGLRALAEARERTLLILTTRTSLLTDIVNWLYKDAVVLAKIANYLTLLTVFLQLVQVGRAPVTARAE